MFAPIIGFFAAMGVFEIIFCSVLFIGLVLATSVDRHGQEGPKWYLVGIGLLTFAANYWPFTIGGVWETVRSWTFWTPVLQYAGLGLVYAGIEFILEVRRSAKAYRASWVRFMDTEHRVPILDDSGNQVTERGNRTKANFINYREIQKRPEYADLLNDLLHNYISTNTIGFLKLVKNEAGTEPEPKIIRSELAASIGAWTTFWPAYAVSLVVGDLFAEVWNILANWFVFISGHFVRMSFANVFKL
jgi:hypothetical protein